MDGFTKEAKGLAEAAKRGDTESLVKSFADPSIIRSYVSDLVTSRALTQLGVLHDHLAKDIPISKEDIAFLITFCSQLAEDNRAQRKRVMELIGAFLTDSVRKQAVSGSGPIFDFRRQA